jgi:hypothetical protein
MFDAPNRPSLVDGLTAFRRDFCAAGEACVFVQSESWRFDIPPKCAAGFEHASFSGINIAIDRPENRDRPSPYLRPDAAMFADRQGPVRSYGAGHLAIDHQVAPELHVALDRYSLR